MKKLKAACLTLLFVGNLIAQESPSVYKEKYKDEFAVTLKDHTTTSIEVKKGKLDINQHTLRQTLFLDKRVSSMGNISLEYQPPFTEIEDLEAYILTPDGDGYSKEKVRDIEDKEIISEDIFYDGSRAKVFTYPGLREGAITSLEYTERIYESKLLSSEIFQGYTMQEDHLFTLEYDKEVEMDIKYFNCSEDDFIYSHEEKSGKIIHRWAPKTYSKIKKESEMPEFLELTPHIIYRIVSYSDGNTRIPVLRNTKDLHKWYSSLLNEVRKDENEEIRSLTDSLVRGIDSDREKTQRIFNWVQNNIKYIAFENGMEGFQPRVPSLIFDRRYGDCKDMSCLTISMLNYAGIPAYHTWIGTRSLPYSYADVPSPLADNHMIACARVDDEYIFLDATDQNLPFPLPSTFIQGKEALIGLDTDSFTIQKIPVIISDLNLNNDSAYVKMNGTSISGIGEREYTGYYANLINRNLNAKAKDELNDVLKYHVRKGNNKCISSGYQVDRQNTKTAVTYNFDVPDYAYENGDEIILNLNLEKIMSDFAIKKDRVHSVVYNYTYKINRKMVLEVPEGYKVSYLPEAQKQWYDDFGFSLDYTIQDKLVLYNLTIDVNTLRIEPEQFETWNAMIKDLNRSFAETLILKKT
ncbi:MAG: DUF3857 domain-containing transglutaminase family protein [Owenweeksia sp.]